MQNKHTTRDLVEDRPVLLFLLLALVCLLPLGCGTGTSSFGGSNPTGQQRASLGGSVIGGQNPITGATIQLYSVGTTGYTSKATPLLNTTVTTNAQGNFSITNDYTCPAGSYVYITASGGDPGLGTGTNSNIALMAALGSCSTLKAQLPFININEVSTVAGAYALAQFSGGSSFGTTLLSQPGAAGTQAPADNFATNSTSVQGLINSMSVAQVLANYSAGTSPGTNANGSAAAEWWQINTIANILSGCVNSAGGVANDGSTNCGILFGNVTVPSGINPATGLAYVAPVDTLQTAVYLALNPALSSAKIANLYGISTAQAPFQPYVASASAITDFSVGITFTPVVPGTGTTLLNQPNWIALDANGNAWVGSQTTAAPFSASLLELDPAGNPIQAGSTSGSSVSNYVIGSYAVNTTVTNITGQYSTTTTDEGTTVNSSANGGYFQLALDTNNNVWFPDAIADTIVKIKGSATAGGANGGNANDSGGNGAAGYKLVTGSGPITIAVDGSNNVIFVMNAQNSSGTSAVCNSTGIPGSVNKGWGEFIAGNSTSTVYGGNSNAGPWIMAIDGGGVYDDAPAGTPIAGAPFLWTQNSLAGNGDGVSGSKFGELFHSYTKSTGTVNTQLCTTPVKSLSATGGQAATLIPVLPNYPIAGMNTYMQDSPIGLAIDGSGSVWIADTKYIVSAGGSATVYSAITKLNPNYGSTLSSANAASNFTFNMYHAVGGMTDSTTGYGPRFLAIDGAGSAWFSIATNCTTGCTGPSYGLGAITNTGIAIAPSTGGGFQGSTCVSCTYNGNTATFSRYLSAPTQLAIDGSGNVWVPMNGIDSKSVTMLVGAATPVVTPLSLGIKNNTLGTKP